MLRLRRWLSSTLSFYTIANGVKQAAKTVWSILAVPPVPAQSFLTMFEAEIAQVRERRRLHRAAPDDPRRNLVGLALSGGGIRSATFCLGFLQGLDKLKLLRLFDYLSTVSGGGFVGAWWSAWLSRPFVIQDVVAAEPLAAALLKELVPGSKRLQRSRDRVLHSGGADPAAVDALRLEVVDELNTLASHPGLPQQVHTAAKTRSDPTALQDLLSQSPPPRHLNARLLETLYAEYLRPRRLFPPVEALEASRIGGYVDPQFKDAALTAGRDLVHHVRLFSNYLTPRKGLLSGDTWLAIAVVSRNLLLTWVVLVPAFMTLALLCQLYFVVQPFDDRVVAEFTGYSTPLSGTEQTASQHPLGARAWVALRPIAALGALVAFMTVLWMGYNNAGVPVTRRATLAMVLVALYFMVWKPLLTGSMSGGSHRYDIGLVALVLGFAGILWWVVWSVPPSTTPGAGPRRQVRGNQATQCHAALLVGLVVTGSVLFFTGFAGPLCGMVASWVPGHGSTVKTVGGIGVGVLTALATIFTALKASPAGGRDARELARPSGASRAIFAATPPLVLIVLSILASWISQRLLSVFSNDGSLNGLTVAAFAGIGLCMLFASYELVDGRCGTSEAVRVRDRVWPLTLLVVTIVVCYSLFGRSLGGLWERTIEVSDIGWMSGWYGLALASSAAVLINTIPLPRNRGRVLFLGLFCLCALALLHLSAARVPDALVGSPGDLRSRPLYIGTALATIMATWVLAVGWMADPNALSLHTFYKIRLVRAYLGASNPRRNKEGKDIRNAVEGDDLRLKDVATCERGGPYPLVNTTLNLVGGHDLSTAQRSSAAFVLSPLYCGSVRTQYRPTAAYMSGELSLGAAVAASGAAVSPNMGARTPSAALAALLAFLNVRLGFWAPSPHRTYWDMPQTRLWPYYVLRESFSQTTEVMSYCYLTDGGHFDNTGLYSLVERGCLFIVVVDNGADPGPCFEDLGDAIRRCRIDFRAEIDLDVAPFRKSSSYRLETGSNGLNGAAIRSTDPAARGHYVVGTITYDRGHLESLGWTDVPDAGVTGRLVWFKPTLTSEETADVRQYALQNAYFPQQTTVDQWFDESQFESYRKLGELYALEAFTTAKQRSELDDERPFTPEHVRRLVTALGEADVRPATFITKVVDVLAVFVGRLGAGAIGTR